MKNKLKGPERRKAVLKDWGKTAVEIAKWVLVLWLLWPLRHASSGPVDFIRVSLGILLFILFAGKLFYDTVIMSIVRRKRTSAKQDFFSLLGIILGLSVVVGLLLLFIGYVLLEVYQMSRSGEDD